MAAYWLQRCCRGKAANLANVANAGNVLRCALIRNVSQSTGSESKEFDLRYMDGDAEGIAIIAINRPAARNAMNKSMLAKFLDAIDEVKFKKSLRAVIIRSDAPGIFCAGADLKERAKMAEEEVGPFLSKYIRGLLTSVRNLPIPTLVALDGAAMGGGLELALNCDIRIAASNAKMGLTETKLAIIPGGGGTQNLPRLIGPAFAKELIFTGGVVDGEQAHRIGIVNHVVKQNEAGDAAFLRTLDLAKHIIPQGPVALRMAKQAINKGLEVDLETGLEIEQMCYAQVIPTKDRMEGLFAFREKRIPKYTGE